MEMRVRPMAALVFALFFVITIHAQSTDTSSNIEPMSPQNGISSASFRPANPYFGNFLVADSAPQRASSDTSSTTPAAELFGGYSYIRFNVKRLTDRENFNLHGGTASIAGNVNRWFGLVADFGGYKVIKLPPGTSANGFTFLFGPKFSHRGDRWTPFAQFLFGAAQ